MDRLALLITEFWMGENEWIDWLLKCMFEERECGETGSVNSRMFDWRNCGKTGSIGECLIRESMERLAL